MALIRIRYWNFFIDATHKPQKAQNKLLRSIIRNNRNTVFGKKYGFASLNSVREYQSRVPVQCYEDLRGLIERQAVDMLPCLTEEMPSFFVLTSGTTSKPKFIPVLESTIRQYRVTQYLAAYAVYRDFPEAFRGKILGIVSPAIEGKLDFGALYGSMSGLIYKSMPKLLRSKYVVPPEVFEIPDYNEKYLQMAGYAIREPNITMIATANPTTIFRLLEAINEDFHLLYKELIKTNAERAAYLLRIKEANQELLLSDLWPKLSVVTVWTGGNCSVLIPRLRKSLPSFAKVVEVGYMSSEFRGGITVDAVRNIEIPTFQHNFFEFVERNNWEESDPQFKLLNEVEVGKQYYIFVTTQNGLYRYNINDLIEITGFFNGTPTIRFVQKGKGVLNLTGEKLYESQLVDAISQFNQLTGTEIQFFIMIGCADSLQYTLYLEYEPIDISPLEHFLMEANLEYAAKRRSDRLKPIEAVFVKNGTSEFYKEYCVTAGQRESQYKLVHLQSRIDCKFDFNSYRRRPI
ncbi:MAG: GH3 auxin-responsive promoter family protein [Pseudohongiellaceae bacterium]